MQAHLHLENLNIPYALLPGDPGRLEHIKKFLTDVEELAYHREYRSLRGKYREMPVLALSTGIGGPSAGIALEELKNIGVRYAIRIGSCGALQKDISLGELILVEGAVREEGTSKMYVRENFPAVANLNLLSTMKQTAEELGFPHRLGIVLSHDSFYMDTEAEESAYWSSKGVLGADMETATLYTIGRLRKICCAAILNNVVLYGQDTSESIGDYAQGESLTAFGEKNEIHLALETFYSIYQKQK